MSVATPSTNRLGATWTAFWTGSTDPHIYAALRVLFGVLGLVTLAGLGDFSTYWTCDGLVMSADGSICQAARNAGVGWLPGGLLLAATVVSFVLVVIGYQSVYAVSGAFISLALIVYWNPVPLSAAQQVLRASIFCLIWADSGRVFSVDARIARRRAAATPGAVAPVPVWPLRLLQVQVASIYFVSGLWKLANVTWRDGSALHYVFENNQFKRFPIAALPIETLLTVATYATLFWELGFAFMLLHRRWRRWALAIGVAMHLGMWATLELGSFSAVMIASYVAFVDPARLRWMTRSASERGPRDIAIGPGGSREGSR